VLYYLPAAQFLHISETGVSKMKFEQSGRFPLPVRHGRDGPMFRASDIEKWIVAYGLEDVMLDCRGNKKEDPKGAYYQMSDVDQAYVKATEVISKAKEGYDAVLADFRSTVKNDLTSISAAADRAQKEAAKINASYRQTIDTLRSNEMQEAIANAERLAIALEKIAQVKGRNLTFSLLDND
jgi:hypothetical protein